MVVAASPVLKAAAGRRLLIAGAGSLLNLVKELCPLLFVFIFACPCTFELGLGFPPLTLHLRLKANLLMLLHLIQSHFKSFLEVFRLFLITFLFENFRLGQGLLLIRDDRLHLHLVQFVLIACDILVLTTRYKLVQ